MTKLYKDSIEQLISEITPDTRRFKKRTQLNKSMFFEGELVQIFPSSQGNHKLVSVATSKEAVISGNDLSQIQENFLSL
jgi:hypothetical protein